LFWNNTKFKKLLMIFTLNGIANAITSNLILFFIETIIKAPEHEGYFLLSFFISCAFSLSIWKRISLKIGKSDAWLYSIISSIIVFLWSFFLTEGDIYFFYTICILSGLCLGADLIIPSAMATEIIYNKNQNHNQSYSGFYFGIWTFATKMNLALAAGLILPILGFFGYNYQMSSYSKVSLFCLSFLYSIVPCCFKIFAAILILKNKKFITNLNEKNSS
jgi:GPH family glycoside/pentoside/hexuronide:cation symporter